MTRSFPVPLLAGLVLAGAAAVARPSATVPPRCPPPGGRPDGTGSLTFDSTAVERDAEALVGDDLPFAIEHPARAVARFVVDTTGRADLRTLTIEPGADSALAAAVRDFMPQARFRPAELRGCLVRVWARWPFTILDAVPGLELRRS